MQNYIILLYFLKSTNSPKNSTSLRLLLYNLYFFSLKSISRLRNSKFPPNSLGMFFIVINNINKGLVEYPKTLEVIQTIKQFMGCSLLRMNKIVL